MWYLDIFFSRKWNVSFVSLLPMMLYVTVCLPLLTFPATIISKWEAHVPRTKEMKVPWFNNLNIAHGSFITNSTSKWQFTNFLFFRTSTRHPWRYEETIDKGQSNSLVHFVAFPTVQLIYWRCCLQGHNEVRWRPGQETSSVLPRSNLRYFGS